LKDALNVIEKIYDDRKTKEAFLAKLAEKHFVDDPKVAEKHFSKGDLKDALNVIEKIYDDRKTKEAFLAKLAKKHFSNGDLKDALNVIDKIYDDTDTKGTLLMGWLEHFYQMKDQNKILEIISSVIKSSFSKMLVKQHLEKNIKTDELIKFYEQINIIAHHLATQHYNTIEIELQNGNKKQALKVIFQVIEQEKGNFIDLLLRDVE
jgi:hypothetical protein